MTPRLYQHNSNRLEVLGERLAALIAERPPQNPLEPVIVVVQTPGVARWLSLRLASLHGCCMNVRYLYPRNFVEEMLERFLGKDQVSRVEPDALAWRLYGMLPRLVADDSRFEQLAGYLSDGSQLKRMQLAERIANTFDQYLTYRPELLLGWEADEEANDWQAELWRLLAAEPSLVPVELGRIAGELTDATPVESLPERVYLFGVSTLPPLYVGLLRLIGEHSEIHLLNLEPAEDFWSDAVSPKTRQRAAASGEEGVFVGNPLLASMGKQGRDFANVLADVGFEAHWTEFIPPEGSLLGAVQDDILVQSDRTLADEEKLPADLRGGLSVSACTGPMREVEVLKDTLLGLFNTWPDLRPRDVLVLTPSIEAMAPYIEAVFGSPEHESERLPYSIADRGPRGESRLLDAFLAILELGGRRLTAREVVAVLEHPAVAARFGFDETELETLRSWIQENAVCWGRDAAHREALGLCAEGQNSWQAGLDRMLLGSAMAADGDERFAGVLPFDPIEGDAVELLGRFCSAADMLLASARWMEQPRPLSEWIPWLVDLSKRALEVSKEEIHEPEHLRSSLMQLRERAKLLENPEEPMDIQALRHVLDGLLRAQRPPGGFLGGGITFAELKPMRSVPARVICLLGMNEDGFPRRDQWLPFDRLGQTHRAGDRSQRDGDRYLFLETLLSAREHLHISYRGRDNEGKALPPSVLVSELLDYVTLALGDSGETTPEALGLRHSEPLQPFDRRYFESEAPKSFSRANLEAARALLGPRHAWSFAGERLPEAPEDLLTVSLRDFVRFFQDPSAEFLKRRLQINLPREEALLPEDEPLALDNLVRHKLETDLLTGLLAGGVDSAESLAAVRARGILPWGATGDRVHGAALRVGENVADKLREFISNSPSACSDAFEIPCGGAARLRLEAELSPIHNGTLLRYRIGKLRSKDILGAWLEWVVACASSSVEMPARLLFVTEDHTLTFKRPEAPWAILEDLAAIYAEGLCEPLPFFVDCARHALSPSKNGQSPRERALDKWRQDAWGGGKTEREAAAVQMLYGEAGPFPALIDRFLDLAKRIWEPCMAHEEISK